MRRGAFILCIIVLLGWVCMASPVHAAVIDQGTGPDGLSRTFTDGGVLSIGEFAFARCTVLTEVQISSSVSMISVNAFFCSDVLTKLALSPSLIRIPSEMASHCLELRQLVIPESVVLAEAGGFADTPALTRVLFLGDAPYAGSENLFHYGNEAVTALPSRPIIPAPESRSSPSSTATLPNNPIGACQFWQALTNSGLSGCWIEALAPSLRVAKRFGSTIAGGNRSIIYVSAKLTGGVS